MTKIKKGREGKPEERVIARYTGREPAALITTTSLVAIMITYSFITATSSIKVRGGL